ncbi:hypothetical protein [Gracilimonas mengyeensis]|nr:hypothetical protein [Gracilimonas mengyeensis]
MEEYLQHLAGDISSSAIDTHIISSEYLFLTNETYVENYVRFLETFYDDIKVCVFLRNPVNYFRSVQQQVIKARSYLTKPDEWKLQFKPVIELWSNYAEVEVIEYEPGVDSCKLFCDWAGIDYSSLVPLRKESNVSISIEQMLLLEKIQSQLYANYENRFKAHLRVLEQIRFTDLNKPKLKEGVRAVVYQKHKQDIAWLEENYAINFLDNELDEAMNDFCIDSETGMPSVRDLFKVPDEEMVEKYEIHVLDLVLKKLAQRATN